MDIKENINECKTNIEKEALSNNDLKDVSGGANPLPCGAHFCGSQRSMKTLCQFYTPENCKWH